MIAAYVAGLVGELLEQGKSGLEIFAAVEVCRSQEMVSVWLLLTLRAISTLVWYTPTFSNWGWYIFQSAQLHAILCYWASALPTHGSQFTVSVAMMVCRDNHDLFGFIEFASGSWLLFWLFRDWRLPCWAWLGMLLANSRICPFLYITSHVPAINLLGFALEIKISQTVVFFHWIYSLLQTVSWTGRIDLEPLDPICKVNELRLLWYAYNVSLCQMRLQILRRM